MSTLTAATSAFSRNADEWLAQVSFAQLLKRHLSEASQLAAVQVIGTGGTHEFQRADADEQVLIHAFAVEVIGHAR